MSLMKVRERQQKSPAAKEFRRVPNQGRAVLFAGAALVLAGAAVWIFVGDDRCPTDTWERKSIAVIAWG